MGWPKASTLKRHERPVKARMFYSTRTAYTPSAAPSWTATVHRIRFDASEYGGKALLGLAGGQVGISKAGTSQVGVRIINVDNGDAVVATGQEAAQATGYSAIEWATFDATALRDSEDQYQVEMQTVAGSPTPTYILTTLLEMGDA